MNAERLLALYEQVAEAPDAVPRLRRFLLDLAVRGKLVPQDAGDEPVAGHLRRIEAASEITRECPDSWVCVQLGQILDFKYGKGMKASERLKEGPVPVFGSNGVVGYTTTPLTDHPAIIIGRKGSAGALNRCDGPSWTTDVAYFVEAPSFLDLQYLFLALQTLELDTLGKGVKPGLSRADAYPLPFPLPPLAEQRRIVAKVEELMALLDRLEAARGQREATRDRLTAASLARLTAPEADPAKFPANARFALATLPALTTRPDQIKPLRQTILNLAVRGKLVDQDPNDEPASELLKRIALERVAFLDADYPSPSEAKTQKKKQAQQRLPGSLPDLPRGWLWATLQQCSLMVIDCKNKTAPYSSTGIKLVRTTNVRDGALNSKDQKFVSEATYEAWSLRAKPEPGDILITREAPMGEVCIIPDGERLCLGQRMMLARLVPETIDGRFMLYSLSDPDLMDRVQDKPLGMTVQHLRVGGVETLLVPLPPLAEQHRIVAKVDALMALCDRLEAALTTADTTRSRLLEALLHEALEPAVTAGMEAAE
jgi:type I restriction enzyme, S subunit